jgi:hypothetical protein
MNLIYTLALITQIGMTDLAQFPNRDACMAEALKLKEQKVQAVCVPKTLHTEKQMQGEIDKAMSLMKYMMTQMKEID